MVIATYANKVFQVSPDKIHTFDDFQYSSELQTEKQDADGAKPSTYLKGSDLDTMGFTIKLDASTGVNPRNEWGDWKRMLEDKTAYPFILGGVPVNGANWLVTKVTPSNVKTDNTGRVLSLDLALQFEEYVRPGSKKDTSTASQKGASVNIPGLYDMLDSQTYAMPDDSGLKRQNPSMILASKNVIEVV